MRVLVLTSLLLALAGCSFNSPGFSARVGNGEVLDVDVGRGGSHCPPGQAKKGAC
jgi:hypothetical protein